MTATLTDLARLHRGILDDPADDALRLIYADALEESGDLARAEFIRLQLQLARMDGRECGGYYCDVDAESGVPIHRGCRWERMSLREHELLRQGYLAWSPFDHEFHKQHHQAISYHRGFVDAVSLPLQAFMDHAASLFAAHPITRIKLSDVEIEEVPAQWGPNAVYRVRVDHAVEAANRWLLPVTGDSYFTEAAASSVLSGACVRHGRDAAKLPKYPTANPTMA